MNLSTPLAQVPRIGPVYHKRLQKLGITSVRDLLFYFPRAYEDFSTIIPVNQAKEGAFSCVAGTILEITQERTFKKRMSLVQAIVQDKSGAMKILWFNQPYLADLFKQGDAVCLAGKVLRDKKGIYLSNPVYEKIQNPKSKIQKYELTHVGRIVPTYAETAGVSSRWLRSVIKMVLAQLPATMEDPFGPELFEGKKFPALKQALWDIHFPDSLESAKEAKERFAFEELFFIMLFILSERKKLAAVKAPVVKFDASLMKRFTDKLPFTLTDAQKKSAWQILKDMEHPRPMNRLLEGDVGSGKTVVAAMAALSCAKAGLQAVFMAPTEILAQQHFKTVGVLLAPFRISIGFLTGSADRFISPKLPNEPIEISRKKLLEKVKDNQLQVLVGTHALIQDKVKFGSLGLVIVDEQHRFGVKQRAALLRKDSLIPHLLSMTATPIPRTLAMTLYGDLDISLINELPKGRKNIKSRVVAPKQRKEAYEFIAKEIKKGRQAFVICPRIEPTADNGSLGSPNYPQLGEPKDEVKSVKEEYRKLSEDVFPKFRVAMLHGKMGAREKEEVMKKFKRGKIDVLVSTSVVEVGVDIPNATVIMVEGAERFGLAQLHQFRGRVGRAKHQSYCLLFTESGSPMAKTRLKAVEELRTGFELAEMDLNLRGPGDFAGTKQWGIPDFAMEQLANMELVQTAKEAAKEILEKDITLKKHPLLKEKLEALKQKLHLE